MAIHITIRAPWSEDPARAGGTPIATLRIIANVQGNARGKMWTLVVHLLILLLAGPTAIARVFNDMQLVQQIMISHYATRGLEDAIYLVSSGAYSVFLHPCSSVYSHSQQWLIPDPSVLAGNRLELRRCYSPMDQGSGEVVCVSLALILLAFSGASPILIWVF